MIRIWHDSAMRWMLLWVPITMLNTSVLVGAVLFRRATRSTDLQASVPQLLMILWLAVAIYLVFGNVRTRCHEIELTLPIPAKSLWRRHMAAVCLAGATVLAGSLAMLAANASLIASVDQQSSVNFPYGSLIGPLLGGLLLAISLIGSVEPGLWKLPARRGYWLLTLGCLAAIPGLLIALADWPWLSTGLCFALAAAITLRAEGRLPSAFRIMPKAALAAPQEESAIATVDRPVRRFEILRTLFNLLHTAPPWKQFTPWMVYGFVALLGFVLAGGINRWKEVDDLRFLYLPLGSYMLFAGLGVITYNLYRIDSFPVSRRTILAILTLPGLFFYCVGYAVGWWAQASAPEPKPLVSFKVETARVRSDLQEGPAVATDTRTMVWVEVDSSFMGSSLTGEVPNLTTSAGESHRAWSEELFKGLAPVAYNPYNTSEETTAEFEAQMLSRAIEDVYGKTIPAHELRERYFVVEDGKVVGLQPLRKTAEGISLLQDFPGLEAPRKGPETPIYMLLVMVPWLLLTALFFRSLRATHSLKYVRRVFWIGLAIPMLAMLGQVFFSLFGLFRPEAGRAYLAILIRSLGASPALWSTTWIVTLAVIGVSYWVAIRQFERAEVPASPINCSLVDWGKVD